jgi:hypothetical protein
VGHCRWRARLARSEVTYHHLKAQVRHPDCQFLFTAPDIFHSQCGCTLSFDNDLRVCEFVFVLTLQAVMISPETGPGYARHMRPSHQCMCMLLYGNCIEASIYSSCTASLYLFFVTKAYQFQILFDNKRFVVDSLGNQDPAGKRKANMSPDQHVSQTSCACKSIVIKATVQESGQEM